VRFTLIFAVEKFPAITFVSPNLTAEATSAAGAAVTYAAATATDAAGNLSPYSNTASATTLAF